ncbi:uncharacterized protein LOC126838976 isoform X5 [Adelges cooleyi]|uniref:uncharacterized protein LOC126838976 isoform X5 n=1 Tax=Adelges cooleyi TaxID=133065 RepID=UPI0021802DE2|nr:uncharacterized protein LOC126838976 isoform X5 [Adelges cooleyi]
MKLFCLLISLFFMEVLAPYDRYMELVHITTIGIKLAYEKNDLTIGGRSEANGLEYLIETMVDNVNNDLTYQNFRHINFLTAVLDHPEILLRRTEVYDDLFDKMIQDIESKLGIDMPGDYFGVEKKLENLANMRRDFVAWSLKSIIRRRMLGSVQDVISLPNCRLLGIYWSTLSPESYISEVNIDSPSRTCIITSCSATEMTFRKIGATWSVFSSYGLDNTLEYYLQHGRPQTAPTY